jgi:hypothetical protein
MRTTPQVVDREGPNPCYPTGRRGTGAENLAYCIAWAVAALSAIAALGAVLAGFGSVSEGAVGQAVLVALVSVPAAIVARSIFRQHTRLLIQNNARMESAMRALDIHQTQVETLLDNPYVPDEIQEFLLDVSELVVNREFAHRIVDRVEDGCLPDKTNPDLLALQDVLCRLRIAEPRLFELVDGAIRGAFITMMLQWPETAKCHYWISYPVATETAAGAFMQAVKFRSVARRERQPMKGGISLELEGSAKKADTARC